MCFICGRTNCCPAFHSLEEQSIFAPAEEAYEKFLEVREQCVKELEQCRNQDEEE